MATLAAESLPDGADEASVSSVSWAAIIAGAVAAAAISLILLVLGSGIGLSVVSPWHDAGAGATTVAVSAGIWLVFVQWLSSGIGGYLTGRLRTKWAGIHSDEVLFRDTAHGFLAWALATIVAAGLLASATTSVIGGGVQAASTVAAGAAQGASRSAGSGGADPTGYFVDLLFRAPAERSATGPASAQDTRTEVTRILAASAAAGKMSDADKTYLAQLIAARTGLPAADAQKRVDTVLGEVDAAKTKAKQAADAARKSGATLALVMFLSLVIGAFIASVAAALGGRQRDAFEALHRRI
jgi:hypothetical protein